MAHLFYRPGSARFASRNQIWRELKQVKRQWLKALVVAVGVPVVKNNVLTCDIPKISHPQSERRNPASTILLRNQCKNADAENLSLSPRVTRPRRRNPEEPDEL